MKMHLLAACAALAIAGPAHAAFTEKTAGTLLAFAPFAPALCGVSQADVELLQDAIEMMTVTFKLDRDKIATVRMGIFDAEQLALMATQPTITSAIAESMGFCTAIEGALQATKKFNAR